MSFFLRTKLEQSLQVMSTSKAFPEGLKNQECKKGNWKKCPPIPYVPVVDEVQEAILKGKECAKLGSHGDKDIAKVMAITNGNAKRGS